MEPPVLKRVERLDSIPLSDTYWTEEGYLIDKPIVTSVGIFEYRNPDGSTRRELRLPEHVFDKDSLASYRGKPVILTHRAGSVDKDNVDREHIGTILSEGMAKSSSTTRTSSSRPVSESSPWATRSTWTRPPAPGTASTTTLSRRTSASTIWPSSIRREPENKPG